MLNRSVVASSAMFFFFLLDSQIINTISTTQTIRTSICIFKKKPLPLHLAARSPFPVTSNKWRGKEREKCVGQDSHSWPADGHFGMSAVGNVRHVCAVSDKGGSIS